MVSQLRRRKSQSRWRRSYCRDDSVAKNLLVQAVEKTSLSESQIKVCTYLEHMVRKIYVPLFLKSCTIKVILLVYHFYMLALYFPRKIQAFFILFIQNWIDHQRRKAATTPKKIPEKLHVRKVRGYDIFRSEYISSIEGKNIKFKNSRLMFASTVIGNIRLRKSYGRPCF